ncbi:MAG: IS5 family transposase [Fimbriimonadaceae bacterium]|nr:IS5 family transposase [Fimbriimonadaceae bacterium]
MKGEDQLQPSLVATINLEMFVAADHKLREVKRVTDAVLADCESEFRAMYSSIGRPSIAPEKQLRALVLMVLYSIPSERRLMEHIRYNMLFRWFVGLDADEAVWDASTFSKNRERLLEGEVARLFFEGVKSHARMRRLMSEDHFTVDGTLLEAWASHKSFKPKKDPPDPPEGGTGSNPEVDFKGESRTNQTHQSTTDPDARMARKGWGKEAKLSHAGHVLMENRNGLVVDTAVTTVEGNYEVDAALRMLEDNVGCGSTVGADKLYDQTKFVEGCRSRDIKPHVARKDKHSRIDGRTTRHEGYKTSQKIRKRVEEIFGWEKTVGGFYKLRYRGTRKVAWIFLLGAAAYNLVRMANITLQTT